MATNTISIIVPIYNVEKYLHQCLKSIVNQTCDNFTTILINDGSTDNSESIAKEFVSAHSGKFKLFNKKNGGLSDARNFALEKVMTEYVMFLDSDDYLTSDTIAVLSNSIKTSPDDVLCFSMVEVTEQGSFVRNIPAIATKQTKTTLKDTPDLLTQALPNACNKLIKTSLFVNNKIKFPKDLWYEDLATTPKLFNQANTIGFIDNNLYLYRNRKDSITQTISPKILDMLTVLSSLKDYFNENVLANNIQQALTNLTINMIVKTVVRIAGSTDKVSQNKMLIELRTFIKQLNKPVETIMKTKCKAIYKLLCLAILFNINRPTILFIKACQKQGIIR